LQFGHVQEDFMLGSEKIIAFIATREPARAKAFYGATLGLRLVSDAFALVFDAAGVMLRVTTVKQIVAAPYTVLGWEVADIVATSQALARAGIVPERFHGLQQDRHGIWRSPSGARILWFKDPDGNTLSLTQF
jgi:catechol 2,3-dioxygenase-like lactoylglutathione lyase family enzyme